MYLHIGTLLQVWLLWRCVQRGPDVSEECFAELILTSVSADLLLLLIDTEDGGDTLLWNVSAVPE
jgi:hypothetical protein